MISQGRLSAVIESPMDRWEEILSDAITPAVRELRSRPELEALFWGRFNKPTWQIQLCVFGPAGWVDGFVRPLLDRRLAPLRESGRARAIAFGPYEPEMEPCGGEVGMRLTERISHHDSLACLDLMEAEAKGRLARSRREFSLVMVERLLDQLRFDRRMRLGFYERGYRWAFSMGSMKPEDLKVLDRKYEELRPGLLALLEGEASRNESSQWGGADPARIAKECLRATGPIIEETMAAHAAGRLSQDLVNLAWFWTGMHSNRLGIVNVSEAVLRYYMHRLYRDGEIGAP